MNCIIYPCSNELIPFIDYIDKIDNELNIVKAICPVICRRSALIVYAAVVQVSLLLRTTPI